MKFLSVTLAAAGMATAFAGAAHARNEIRVVGSSTVFPYTQAVAEEFSGKYPEYPAPVIESTGTGGGMKIFCQGVGEAHPDIEDASRAMKPSEWALCQKNGVDDITEAMIGYDGLSIAVSRSNPTAWNLTKAQIFKALAKEIPTGDGKLVPNPYRKWSQIDPNLPDIPITVYGPPPTSGTRDAFVELAMHEGCKELPEVQALKKGMDKKAFKKWVKTHCSPMRQDGPFIEAGENDNLIVQRLEADPNALGIFGFSFLYENEDKLKAVSIEGVAPSPETIASFEYTLSRPLFIYVKNAHRGVIPGLKEFLEEYASEDALGPDGYLVERGLVPLPDDLRAKTRKILLDAVPMKAPGAQ